MYIIESCELKAKPNKFAAIGVPFRGVSKIPLKIHLLIHEFICDNLGDLLCLVEKVFDISGFLFNLLNYLAIELVY